MPTVNIDVIISAGNSLLINGEQLQYKSINLTYSDADYGLIEGLTRGINATGTSEIAQYDIVQNVLSENILDAKYVSTNWYQNNLTMPVVSSTGNTYTFSHTATTDTSGLSTYPELDKVASGAIVSFGNIASNVATFGSDSFTANVVANVTTGIYDASLGKTISKYVFDISDLNNANIAGNSLAVLNSTGSHIVGLSSGGVLDLFTARYANGNSVTHGTSANTSFRIVDSYVNSSNSSQWIIEADMAGNGMPTTATITFSNAYSKTYTVSNSYVTMNGTNTGNTWNLVIDGGPIATASVTAISVEYNSGYPLQMDNSDVAQFLNKQFR
jgi:hypothetical protein